MKLFSRKKNVRRSLDAFKNHSASVDINESMSRITGGMMSGCHKVGGGSGLIGSLQLNAAQAISTMPSISMVPDVSAGGALRF